MEKFTKSSSKSQNKYLLHQCDRLPNNNSHRTKTTTTQSLTVYGVLPKLPNASSISINISTSAQSHGICTLMLHRFSLHPYPTATTYFWHTLRRALKQRKWIMFASKITLYLTNRDTLADIMKLSLSQTKGLHPYLGQWLKKIDYHHQLRQGRRKYMISPQVSFIHQLSCSIISRRNN